MPRCGVHHYYFKRTVRSTSHVIQQESFYSLEMLPRVQKDSSYEREQNLKQSFKCKCAPQRRLGARSDNSLSFPFSQTLFWNTLAGETLFLLL